MCEVLDEIRALDKTRNYAPLMGLVEELQSMGNKMEGALGDKKDVERMQMKRAKLKKEIKELKKQLPDKGEEE